MTLRWIAVAFLGLALAGVCVWQFTDVSELRQENAALKHKLDDKRAADLQANKLSCADRTRRQFAAYGYSEQGETDGNIVNYKNHYSERLGRCLMLLSFETTLGNAVRIERYISDVDERIDLGVYVATGDILTVKMQPPDQCDLTLPHKAKSECHSPDEWDAFAKDIMSS